MGETGGVRKAGTAERIDGVVSEGGGMRFFGPYIRKVSLSLPAGKE